MVPFDAKAVKALNNANRSLNVYADTVDCSIPGLLADREGAPGALDGCEAAGMKPLEALVRDEFLIGVENLIKFSDREHCRISDRAEASQVRRGKDNFARHDLDSN